jgi:hypothetical protein
MSANLSKALSPDLVANCWLVYRSQSGPNRAAIDIDA